MKKRWFRRLFYLLIVLVWLAAMSFPILAFSLAGKGELTFGDDTRSQLRLFLVQESGVDGVGAAWTRPYRADSACSTTTIRYLLWEGSSDNTVYCQCFDEQTGAALPTTLQACGK